MDERFQRFRALMSQINPAEDPASALDRGVVVVHPGGLARRLADHLALHPSSTHVLVGGIGSGKSTELLAAARLINQRPNMRALYIDVSREQELSALKVGDLALLVGLAVANDDDVAAIPEAKKIRQEFKDAAFGHAEDYYPDYYPHQGPSEVWVAGRLKRPGSHWYQQDLLSVSRPLWRLLGLVPHGDLVVIFDSLDRLDDDKLITSLLDQDVRALQSIGVGVVVALPQRLLYGTRRSIVDRVEVFHHLPFIDVERDPASVNFLLDVLRARTPVGMLPDEVARELVMASGGVLRDLIALTRGAAQRAFTRGAEQLEINDALGAILSFGADHRLGLDEARAAALEKIRYGRTGDFTPTTDINQELIETRRILHYAGPDGDRYALHPTLTKLRERRAAT